MRGSLNTPQFRLHNANLPLKKTVNNVETVLDRRKVTRKHYEEIWVELSESAILATLRRHLATEIALTSFQA
jgi:hypothetical protein